ncbi:metallophosphoesterase [Acidianus sp. RZ1]|uniref:metallophosphoesterase n=1 Tax=Acidianus sp. RZ1 TaxID=1540082 RepID=UPI0014920D6C|nr:metallophosphoesterase [Acidianus sp. RZ1]NON61808.1 metallophosphoesterase [Acidianus sp. RZ1]
MIEIEHDILIEEDLPVLYLRSLNAVVLSDVHIGYEEEMARKGIFLPKVQEKRFLNIYKKALDIFKPKYIIIDGDFKHQFNGLGRQEREQLNDILSKIKEDNTEVKIVKGNHDNYITLVSDKFDNVEVLDQITADNVVILHGHKDVGIEKGKIYIIGHEHPRISLRDRLGFSRKLQCFLDVPLKEDSKVIILPSTGIYQSGNDVTLSHSSYMSPIIKTHSILEKARPFVIVEGEGIIEFPELGILEKII